MIELVKILDLVKIKEIVRKHHEQRAMDKGDPKIVKKDVAQFVSNFNKLTFSFDDGTNPYEIYGG